MQQIVIPHRIFVNNINNNHEVRLCGRHEPKLPSPFPLLRAHAFHGDFSHFRPSSTNLINALKLVPRPFIDASVFDFGGALAITPFLSRESYPLLPSLSQVDHSPLGAVPNARGRQKPAQR